MRGCALGSFLCKVPEKNGVIGKSAENRVAESSHGRIAPASVVKERILLQQIFVAMDLF